MNELEGGPPLMRSGVSKRIWNLIDEDPDAFKKEVIAFFAVAYPGFTVVRAKYPDIYLRDDRRQIL
jgi:hypothetical protein